ncbi:MAG: Asp-tRNA(Asn)/Glu-tRNA(Gln) amidotransferase GatCAB subunit B, partial [Chloroflexi bacterium]|nr:Asp-tRNA(Asn)/Glu-tRNA(Gln) amidotransferase GatCAB subunit B [Chloroflexota bacterium]
RFIAEHNLTVYDANLLTSSKAMADYFEACIKTPEYVKLPPDRRAKEVSNWLLGEFNRLLNATNTEIKDSRVTPEQLCQLLDLIYRSSISGTTAKLVFEEMFNTGKQATDIIAERGLSQISDTQEVREVVSQVIAANAQAVADYKAGKTPAQKFLVGQVMKATGGRANPKLVNELLEKKLKEE